MPRAAGTGSNYTFVLNGDDRYSISLPSVTTIIDSVLAKPALVGWGYKTGILGAQAAAADGDISDITYDALKGRIHSLGKSTKAVQDEAKVRGTEAHDILEHLCKGEMYEPPKTPYAEAVVQWWKDEGMQPKSVREVERPVWSLKHGFCGTMDMMDSTRRLTDLKTSSGIYESHIVQVGAYGLAWNEMYPDRSVREYSILLAKEDGTYEERIVEPDPQVFLALLRVYNWLKEAKNG